jgi:hypothetical protein
VHGAWADASGWNGVIRRLQADGYTIIAPPNQLRGAIVDGQYLAALPTYPPYTGTETMKARQPSRTYSG